MTPLGFHGLQERVRVEKVPGMPVFHPLCIEQRFRKPHKVTPDCRGAGTHELAACLGRSTKV